jgi:opacity protein-like surface antigen
MRGIWGSSVAAILVSVSSGAFAADLVKAPPPAPVLAYNWTGFYIGLNWGGAWSSGTLTDNFTGASFTGGTTMGFVGGGTVGYNWQGWWFGPQFVIGVEGTFDGASMNRSGTATVLTPNLIPTTRVLEGSVDTNWVATVAGRVGYTVNLGNAANGNAANIGNALFYAKGGAGWVENSATLNVLTTAFAPIASFSASNTNSGWLVGGGIEYGVTANWTVKVEYNYLGLSNLTRTSPLFVGDSITLSRKLSTVLMGVNYKFW